MPSGLILLSSVPPPPEFHAFPSIAFFSVFVAKESVGKKELVLLYPAQVQSLGHTNKVRFYFPRVFHGALNRLGQVSFACVFEEGSNSEGGFSTAVLKYDFE